jgi:hypothetical protein
MGEGIGARHCIPPGGPEHNVLAHHCHLNFIWNGMSLPFVSGSNSFVVDLLHSLGLHIAKTFCAKKSPQSATINNHS